MAYYEGSGTSLANFTLFLNGSFDYEVYSDDNITDNSTEEAIAAVSGLLALLASLPSVLTSCNLNLISYVL